MKTIKLALASALLLLGGCASNGDPRDPLEPLNRSIHAFNETVDRVAMKPLAEAYRAVAPQFVETGVRNVFSNLGDVGVLANDLLQFKGADAVSDFMRLAFNSTFGLFGLLDVASEMGLRKHEEDFGQTLGKWGVTDSPYLVLPFFGPSTFRDTVGLAVDNNYLDPLRRVDDMGIRNRSAFARIVSRRADLLEAKAAVDAAALDGYEFTRDIYLERRRAQVYDGRPPRSEE
ncbi:MAG TPA: VacJ family lipoprotein [Thiobacillaceae bacterium]|nr:VacJ family lipoprotein [Thiobacillaceae bacterium]